MQVLIVVDDPHNWPLDISGVKVVAAREYVMNSAYGALRAAKVVNLCRSYRTHSQLALRRIESHAEIDH